MNKDKEKSKKPAKSWESFGVAFWITMTVSSAIMAILGLVTFSFALLRILYGDIWFMWFVLATAGAGAFSLAVFCFDLFPTWAGIVRTIRLSDARIAGAMSISQINKYEEREDRRTAEVKDKVQESYSKVGKDVLATQKQVTEMDDKLSKMLQAFENYRNAAREADAYKNIESSMDAINRKLEKYVSDTDRAINNLKNQMNSIEDAKTDIQKPPVEDVTTHVSDIIPPAVGKEEPNPVKKPETKVKKKTKKQEKAEEKAKEVFGESKSAATETKAEEVYNDGFNEDDDDLSGMPEDYADALSRMPYSEEELDDIIDSYPDSLTQSSELEELEDAFTTTNVENESEITEDKESSSGNPYADL